MANKDKRNPSQKIEDLERAVIGLYETMNNIARDLAVVKEGLKLLGQKANAIIRVGTKGFSLNADTVNEEMTQITIEEMKGIVETLVSQGVLSASNVITENSFIVGRDLLHSDQTVVANPRLQFAMAGIPEDIRPKLVGSKVGDILQISEGKDFLEIMEVYAVGSNEAPASEEETSEGAVESTEATTEEAASG